MLNIPKVAGLVDDVITVLQKFPLVFMFVIVYFP